MSDPIAVDDVDVRVNSGDLDVDPGPPPTGVQPGGVGLVTGTVSCETEAAGSVTVSIEASSDAVLASIDGAERSFEVACEPGTRGHAVDGVRFRDDSDATIASDRATVNATVWYLDDNGIGDAGELTLNTSEPVGDQFDSGDSRTVLGLSIPEDEVSHVHGNYDFDRCRLPTGESGADAQIAAEPDPFESCRCRAAFLTRRFPQRLTT